MKKLTLVLLALVFVLALAGCGCEHEWAEANCTDAKTCKLCDETEGAPLGHSWAAANCTEAKTCEICGATEGEPKGHTWEAATCTTPEKCSLCHEIKGEPLDHNWEEATTETPKTCTNCQATEGTKIDTDPRFTTDSTKHLQGRWTCDTTLTKEMMGLPDEIAFDDVECTLIYEFRNNGEMKGYVEIHDQFAFLESMRKAITDVLYSELASAGYSKAAANAEMKKAYGMTIEEYVSAMLEEMDTEEIFGEMTTDGVYYAGENKIYIATSWSDTFKESDYTLEDGVLIIEKDSLEKDGEFLRWTREEV